MRAALMVIMMMANRMERLFERVMPIPVTGCWIWEGSDSGNGYGKVSIGGRDCMVHRVVYELLVGPIPRDRVLDPRGRVRRCCNPDHLAPVTGRGNTHRGDAVLFGTTVCHAHELPAPAVGHQNG